MPFMGYKHQHLQERGRNFHDVDIWISFYNMNMNECSNISSHFFMLAGLHDFPHLNFNTSHLPPSTRLSHSLSLHPIHNEITIFTTKNFLHNGLWITQCAYIHTFTYDVKKNKGGRGRVERGWEGGRKTGRSEWMKRRKRNLNVGGESRWVKKKKEWVRNKKIPPAFVEVACKEEGVHMNNFNIIICAVMYYL